MNNIFKFLRSDEAHELDHNEEKIQVNIILRFLDDRTTYSLLKKFYSKDLKRFIKKFKLKAYIINLFD